MLLSPRSFRRKVNGSFYPPSSSGVGTLPTRPDKPSPRRTLRFDKPWEGAFCGYATVIHDGPRYRLYYRGLPASGRDGSGAEVTCYAESRDGVTWTKPD